MPLEHVMHTCQSCGRKTMHLQPRPNHVTPVSRKPKQPPSDRQPSGNAALKRMADLVRRIVRVPKSELPAEPHEAKKRERK